MKKLYGVLPCIALFVSAVAIVAAQEPQKISVNYEAYIPEGWVAWDQFGTHGMGDTRKDAIEDCKRTYESRLKRLGVKVKTQKTDKPKVVKEFPKQPGYYWYKNEFNGGWQVVEAWRNDQGFWMIGSQLTDENYMENFVTDETVWCGPIPEPPSE